MIHFPEMIGQIIQMIQILLGLMKIQKKDFSFLHQEGKKSLCFLLPIKRETILRFLPIASAADEMEIENPLLTMCFCNRFLSSLGCRFILKTEA